MEVQLKKVIEHDEDDFVEFEDYLPGMVYLIRTKVTPEDEEEIANELFDIWFPDKTKVPGMNGEEDIENMKIKAQLIVKSILFLKKFISR